MQHIKKGYLYNKGYTYQKEEIEKSQLGDFNKVSEPVPINLLKSDTVNSIDGKSSLASPWILPVLDELNDTLRIGQKQGTIAAWDAQVEWTTDKKTQQPKGEVNIKIYAIQSGKEIYTFDTRTQMAKNNKMLSSPNDYKNLTPIAEITATIRTQKINSTTSKEAEFKAEFSDCKVTIYAKNASINKIQDSLAAKLHEGKQEETVVETIKTTFNHR